MGNIFSFVVTWNAVSNREFITVLFVFAPMQVV